MFDSTHLSQFALISVEKRKMTPRYQSVDALQNALAQEIFAHTGAAKKAAGRALGTFVELITFYMIRDWGLENSLAIERGLPEYGNPEITHNVEFTLHPANESVSVPILDSAKSLTSYEIMKAMEAVSIKLPSATRLNRTLLDTHNILRHATTFAEEDNSFWTAHMVGSSDSFNATRLEKDAYAMFECKRVGIEEGQKKGPQTIEKAKQGAYVARTVSGLQRVPKRDGTVAAVVENKDGDIQHHNNYYKFLRDAIDGKKLDSLVNVVLSVGVVSNHGNWFTHETKNKEMKVLAQSYDWLIFLTDSALAQFIQDILMGKDPKLQATRDAFKHSFGERSGKTSFTKVTINADADRELTEYFKRTQPWDEWFNVIAPAPSDNPSDRAEDGNVHEGENAPEVTLTDLKNDLHALRKIHTQVKN